MQAEITALRAEAVAIRLSALEHIRAKLLIGEVRIVLAPARRVGACSKDFCPHRQKVSLLLLNERY